MRANWLCGRFCVQASSFENYIAEKPFTDRFVQQSHPRFIFNPMTLKRKAQSAKRVADAALIPRNFTLVSPADRNTRSGSQDVNNHSSSLNKKTCRFDAGFF